MFQIVNQFIDVKFVGQRTIEASSCHLPLYRKFVGKSGDWSCHLLTLEAWVAGQARTQEFNWVR